MIAYEIFHYLNINNKSQKGYIGIKMEMDKAYDKLEQWFIKKLAPNGVP